MTDLHVSDVDHHLDDNLQCPHCSKTLNGATGMHGDEPPEAGDVTVCAYCYSFLQFDGTLQLLAMTQEEVGELPDDIRNGLVRVRKMLKHVDARTKG